MMATKKPAKKPVSLPVRELIRPQKKATAVAIKLQKQVKK